MDLFVFSSANLTNVWAGVGSRSWAVSLTQAENASIQGRAKNLQVGSLGIFYCVEEKCLTTPFMVSSRPRAGEFVTNIWPEKWALPFGIQPLGSPHKRVAVSALRDLLPSLKDGKAWSSLLHVAPGIAFAASDISREDWAALVSALAQA
jgi:hypothetical protein